MKKNDNRTSIELIPEVRELLERELKTFHVIKYVLNASVWLFSQASRDDKDEAMAAIHAMEQPDAAARAIVQQSARDGESAKRGRNRNRDRRDGAAG